MARKPNFTCPICGTPTTKKNIVKTEYFPEGICNNCKQIIKVQKVNNCYVVLLDMGENNFNGKWLLGIAYNVLNLTNTLELGGKRYPRNSDECETMFNGYVYQAQNNYTFG